MTELLAGSALRSSSPKRYLFVIKNLVFLYSHFWPMAVAVQNAGWEVWIAGDANADPRQVLDAGMKFLPLRSTSGLGGLLGETKAVLELNSILRQVKPDLVHFIYLKNVLTGGILARLHRTPAVLGAITGLGSLFADEKNFLYRVIRKVVVAGLRIGFRRQGAAIAFENGDDQNYFVANGAVLREQSWIIPGAGVDVRWMTYLPWKGDTPVILCTARMIRDKGIMELVEACRILRLRQVKFELLLVGAIDPGNPTSLTEQYLRNVEEEGIGKWLGQRSDISSLLQAASIFCLPTYYREGLPRVLVEACAAGRPIVTTDVPGCRDVVEHGVNGLLVPPKDALTLADALQLLILDAPEREKMGITSRQLFEKNFTMDSVLEALNQCYRILGVPLALKTEHSRCAV